MAENVHYKMDVGLALGIIVFCWVTVKATLQIEDGPTITIYGYPFFWHWWDAATFKIRVINPLALFANLMLYIGTIGIIGHFVAFWGRSIPVILILKIVMWIFAIVAMVHLVGFFYESGITIAWQLPPGKISNEVWYIGRYYHF
ncbi:MAG TPA: hypothetical protein PKM25_02955 [Candidatus Ozemobacteraceae bacterium]|nr:hypothetical protein [Candidatus Ozemobacteraceae bacterium]